ncbi:MAG TPA: MmgE/PrpD family protein [Vicinamibacterales bacterium]|nr:MmgE/PrpD family protein [Vicinamibacterales bacterium]
MSAIATLAKFIVTAKPPAPARHRAATAFLDTVGVTLAGAGEPAAKAVQDAVAAPGTGQSIVFGTPIRTSPGAAALANGTAAHALDYDDMCFVSLAHPSAPLVPAALAVAELRAASGQAALEAYVLGFEIEARLGIRMQPRHYQRGWHPTSTLGTLGAAAAASRLLGLDLDATSHALAIAASQASGLKENFGTMIKPLHAGLAAHNGIMAALLAERGLTGSALALDGPQGFLTAMDGQHPDLGDTAADLGTRWEILDTGITVKLYPSCAGTHPALDALLLLRRRERFTAADVEAIEIDVDSIAPTILIHDRPSSGLEGKFSMPFCAAAAVVHGRVGLDTFEPDVLGDSDVRALMSRITMHADAGFDGAAPPLTQSRVTVRLRDGRTLVQSAHGARGYPDQPASDDELAAKFKACASRTLSGAGVERALAMLRAIDTAVDVREVTKSLAGDAATG